MECRSGGFRFNDLSAELALEIIRFAADPTVQFWVPKAGKRHYADALSLSCVSSAFYRATMPHLLSAIIITNDKHLALLVRALKIQKQRRRSLTRLQLNYSALVRRIWISDCVGHIGTTPADSYVDYTELFELIRVADVGLGTISVEVLCSILASPSNLPAIWPIAKRFSYAGSFLRWNPLVSTYEGQAFLSGITHLILWDGSNTANIASCLKSIPFAYLPNLSHLAVSSAPGHMLVYIGDKGAPAPKIFKEWCNSRDPTTYGVIVPFKVDHERKWGSIYARGDYNVIWKAAYRVRRKGH